MRDKQPGRPPVIHFSETSDLEKVVLDVLSSARTRICISHSMVRSRAVCAALTRASAAGVSVTVLAGQIDEEVARRLTGAGAVCRVFDPSHVAAGAVRKFHDKLIIVDDTVAALGSVNLFQRSLTTDGETLVVTGSRRVLDSAAAHWEELAAWDAMRLTGHQRPTALRRLLLGERVLLAALAVSLLLNTAFLAGLTAVG